MFVYVDESGDTGWKFSKSYQKGGSSRYLTIAFLLIPSNKKKLTERIVRKLYNQERVNFKQCELKGTKLSKESKFYFCTKVVNLLKKHNDIHLLSITVNKQKVQNHLREEPNKLYNYMINLAIIDKIANYDEIHFIPDPRTIKVKSGNSLVDYLQIKLWFELNTKTNLIVHTVESKNCYNLQFIDFIANIIWLKYERNLDEYYNLLLPYLNEKLLYF